MNYKVVQKNGATYIECLPGPKRIENDRDAVDLVAICGEHGVNRLMLKAENLTHDFYDLKTGVAGSILLKFVTYYLRVAAVLAPEQIGQGRFREMVLETNRGDHFRVFTNRCDAEKWLTSG